MSATDKIKNAWQNMLGKAKEAGGKASDDKKLQTEGKTDQAAADLKQAGENVKDTFKDGT
ncbi:MAG: CsbD family protein [Nocardioidaceae bacterium]